MAAGRMTPDPSNATGSRTADVEPTEDYWRGFAAGTAWGEGRYRPMHEWLWENYPRALELCPYKVSNDG